MSDKYSKRILIRLSIFGLAILCLCRGYVAGPRALTTTLINEEDDGVIKTTTRKNSYGVEFVEHAFHAPSKGLPNHVIDMFCAHVKLRLYWRGYRGECKQTHRKGIYLRRMARFAKHVFNEIRDVDKPFNATMLSKVDKFLAAKFDQPADNGDRKEGEEDEEFDEDEDEIDLDQAADALKPSKMQGVKEKLARKWTDMKSKHNKNNHHEDPAANELLDEIDSSEAVKTLRKQGQSSALARIRKFAKSWNFKKMAMWIYTRWRTLWWMALSCLYVKYYLWDPALDDFTKLKRSLLMWPELQLVKLQDVQCKPVIFFRRVMDICKILNPLMKFDLGQFNYNALTRFKADA